MKDSKIATARILFIFLLRQVSPIIIEDETRFDLEYAALKTNDEDFFNSTPFTESQELRCDTCKAISFALFTEIHNACNDFRDLENFIFKCQSLLNIQDRSRKKNSFVSYSRIKINRTLRLIGPGLDIDEKLHEVAKENWDDRLKNSLNYLIDDIGEEELLNQWKNSESIEDFQQILCFGVGYRGPCRLLDSRFIKGKDIEYSYLVTR
ncbi:DgyrCDS7162 [Dimorphilus gyrociliatus]|uniref:DgyrCDS7162 n=1 Tax=Dimorphilus gyrociliatus TaxID=2664684 RepID=A0A7I8VSV9_9ANNE|nr:DgyrCDS7162 [Dimorphilus gyrociliatus]